MKADRLSPLRLRDQDRSLDAGGFVVNETVRPAGLALPWHFHPNTNIALVLEGSFIESVGQRPEQCDRFSLVIRPRGEAHYNQYGRTEARCIVIEVKPDRLEALREVCGILEHSRHIREGRASLFANRIHHEFRIMDNASSLALEALALELLAQTSRRQPETFQPGPLWLGQAREFIREQFTEPLTLSGIADYAGVHPAHLARMFRRHFRCSVGDYLRRVRLNYAEDQLAHSNKSISEIAMAAGFYDQSHLSHAFKLHAGLTPGDYRAAARRK